MIERADLRQRRARIGAIVLAMVVATDRGPAAALEDAELHAFAEAAAAATPPDRLTACRGWSAHDLLAHVVAGGLEIARLVDARLAGGAPSPTTPFAEREAPLRALPYDLLVEQVVAGGLLELIDRLDDDDTVEFTGWTMDPTALRTHVRSELALHRWDLTGSDEAAVALIAQPDLTAHAVRCLTSFDVIAERVAARTRPTSTGTVTARLRSESLADIVIEIGQDRAHVELRDSEPAGSGLTTDPAARLLLLWGRRPPLDHHVVTSSLDAGALGSILRWLHC